MSVKQLQDFAEFVRSARIEVRSYIQPHDFEDLGLGILRTGTVEVREPLEQTSKS